jgi:hypothetical protein
VTAPGAIYICIASNSAAALPDQPHNALTQPHNALTQPHNALTQPAEWYAGDSKLEHRPHCYRRQQGGIKDVRLMEASAALPRFRWHYRRVRRPRLVRHPLASAHVSSSSYDIHASSRVRRPRLVRLPLRHLPSLSFASVNDQFARPDPQGLGLHPETVNPTPFGASNGLLRPHAHIFGARLSSLAREYAPWRCTLAMHLGERLSSSQQVGTGGGSRGSTRRKRSRQHAYLASRRCLRCSRSRE